MNETIDNPPTLEQEMKSRKAGALFMDRRPYNKSLQFNFFLQVVEEWRREQNKGR